MIIVLPIALIIMIIDRVMDSLSYVMNRLNVAYFELLEKYHDFFCDVLQSIKRHNKFIKQEGGEV